MSDIHRLEIVIDRSVDLAPQLVVYRAMGVPWKFLEELTGRRKNRLEEAIARFQREHKARAISPGLSPCGETLTSHSFPDGMQGPPSPPSFIYQQPAPPPDRASPEVEEGRRRQLVISQQAGGRTSTLLAGAAQPDPTRREPMSRLLGNFGSLG
jgi:hypothetical protein